MPPVAAPLAGAFAAIAASPILTFAAQLGAGLVLSAAARALAPRPANRIGEQRVSVRAPAAPRDIVYGRVRKGGVMIFAHSNSAAGRDYLHLIYALAGHPIDAIEAIYFDGELAVNVTAGTVMPRYQDSLGVAFRLGGGDNLTPITADLLPPELWTSAHLCLGVPILYLRLAAFADDSPNGLPNVSVLLRGKNDVLDVRTGLRGYSANAALCLADYMSSAQYGLGLEYGVEGGIDGGSLIAASNVCDELVPVIGASPEPRYQANGVISSAASPKENIEALLTAMGGQAVYSGDTWRIFAASYRTPTVALTQVDIRAIDVQTRRSIADNFNCVRGQFIAPQNDWQPDDFPGYRSGAYIAEDQGIESWRDIALPFTTSSSCAQRLARIELEKARRQQVVQVSGMLSAWRAQVGDVVTLSYPRWGFDAKPFEVRKVTMSVQDGALLPELTLAEISPLQFEWTVTEEQIYQAAPRTTLPDPFVIGKPGVPVAVEGLYETRSGTVEVKADLSWAASPGPFVDFYEVQSRRIADASGATIAGAAFTTLVRTSLTVAEQFNLSPGSWEWRVRAVSTLGRRSDWSTTIEVVQGFSTPPGSLEAVTIQANGNTAILKWALPADLDVRIGGRVLIRHSGSTAPSWGNSVSMDEVAGSTTTATVPLKPGTYLLRPVDSSGIAGDVVTVATKGATWVPFASVTTISEHPTWPGVKTNVEVDGGAIRLTDVADEGVYVFDGALDLTTERAVRLRSEIDVSALALSLTIDARLDLIDDWPDFDGVEGADTDVIVEVRTTDDDPAGTPDWTGWTRLDATEDAFRAAQFRARLISRSSDFNPLVAALSIRVDEAS